MKNTPLPVNLDQYDLAMLNVLQHNGRISVVDLARKINLSATPCTARLKRLESAGVIVRYQAKLSPVLLDRQLLVFLQIRLSATDEKTLQAFNQAIQNIPQIMECHMVGGGFDYLLKVRVKDMNAFRDFLAGVISQLPEVENTHSYFVMEQVKETSALAIM